MNPPNINLQPGQSGNSVAQLQYFLLEQGLLSEADIATGPGIFGPRTTNAVAQWQQQNGVDNSSGQGYWGPRSISAASRTSREEEQEEEDDEEMIRAIENHPSMQTYLKNGSTARDLAKGAETGDWSRSRDEFGQPFDMATRQQALRDAEKQDEKYYAQLKVRETQQTESQIAQKQANYQDYLLSSGQQFEEDKAKMDQTAADTGTLFSGGRRQKEKKMETAYNQNQALNRRNTESSIGSTAMDYQYKYGNKAAKGMSSLYKLGGNSYNANVARGGVGSSGLSKAYNPRDYDFGGSRVAEQKAEANQGAARILGNKGNKLMRSGYNNKY